MLRRIVFAFALIAVAGTAHAQINLAWRNCITITSGTNSQLANLIYACDGSAPTPFKGVMSFISPAALGQFVGVQAVLDIQSDSDQATLPNYWRMGLGECREGSFIFPASLTGVGNTASCRNPWAGGNTGGGFQYTSGSVTPSRARVLFAFARDTDVQLINGQQYIAGVFTIDTYKDIDAGEGECVGCLEAACLVLNQIELYQVAGQTPPQQDIYYLNTAATRQEIYWQGGGYVPCFTPTRRTSWGRIKTTYR